MWFKIQSAMCRLVISRWMDPWNIKQLKWYYLNNCNQFFFKAVLPLISVTSPT